MESHDFGFIRFPSLQGVEWYQTCQVALTYGNEASDTAELVKFSLPFAVLLASWSNLNKPRQSASLVSFNSPDHEESNDTKIMLFPKDLTKKWEIHRIWPNSQRAFPILLASCSILNKSWRVWYQSTLQLTGNQITSNLPYSILIWLWSEQI